MSVSVEIHKDTELVRVVRELVLEDYKGPGKPSVESREKYRWLREAGSSLWLDSGDASAIEKVWGEELIALTTNNTLVNQVVQTGSMDGFIAYGARRIREARPDISLHDLVVELSFLVNAKLALSLVERFGAHVSVELHPDLGYDIEGVQTFGRRYYDINPDFFYIKVPLTTDGFIAVRRLSDEGIPVNFTLGFSARQNYLATRFSRPMYVNVFLGRLNSVVEENGVGKPENVGERVALASNEIVNDLRRGSNEIYTEQIAASIRNGRQVADLAGIDVLTIPPKAAGEYLEMDVKWEDIRLRNWRDLPVDIDPVIAPYFDQLWDIDPDFLTFVDAAVDQVNQMKSGSDLMRLSEEHGVNLFHQWTPEERRQIREDGKIPDLKQWPGVPVDDLLSMSALESFAKDQEELDKRIEDLLK